MTLADSVSLAATPTFRIQGKHCMVHEDEVASAQIRVGGPSASFQVQRPLSEVLVVGHILTEGDVTAMKESLARRDAWIAHYQEQETVLSDQVRSGRIFLQEVLENLRVPLTGYGLQHGKVHGLYHDLWVSPTLTFAVRLSRPVVRLTVHGWVPDDMPSGGKLILQVAEQIVAEDLIPGPFSVCCEVSAGVEEAIPVRVEATKCLNPEGSDKRMLAFILLNVELEHIA